MPHLTGAGGEREEPTDGALMLQTDSMTVEKAFWRIKERLSLV
jgi:hypothetical protein